MGGGKPNAPEEGLPERSRETRAAIPTDLLLRLIHATPEEYAAVARILGVERGEGRGAGNIEQPTLNIEPGTKGEGGKLNEEVAQRVGDSPSEIRRVERKSSEPRAAKARRELMQGEDEGGAARMVFRKAGSSWLVVFEGTQFDLARRVGVSESQIGKIETGRALPEDWLKELIAQELNIHIWEVGV